MALKLPRLQQTTAIVNDKGQPTVFFQTLFNDAMQKIEEGQGGLQIALDAIEAQQALLESQQAQILVAQQQMVSQLDLINQALAEASAANGGSSANTIADISYTGWTAGPQVDLTGVAAGNLTILGTSLQPISTTRLSTWPGEQYGELRVVEVVGGIDTVVFGPEPFITGRDENPSSVPYILNPETIGTFTTARSTTGAVSYRLDAQMDVTPVEMQDVRFNIQVKRS